MRPWASKTSGPSETVHWFKGERRLVFATTVIVISVIAWVFLDRASEQAEQLEAAMMETTLSHIEQALLWKTLEMSLHNQKGDLQNFVNKNPFEWLKQHPLNYSGIEVENIAQKQAGRWYFDQNSKTIIYKVMHTDVLRSDSEDKSLLRFQVYIDYIDRNKSGRLELKSDRLVGLKLKSLQEYEWLSLPWGKQISLNIN